MGVHRRGPVPDPCQGQVGAVVALPSCLYHPRALCAQDTGRVTSTAPCVQWGLTVMSAAFDHEGWVHECGFPKGLASHEGALTCRWRTLSSPSALLTARVMDVEPLLGRLVIHWADAEHVAEVAHSTGVTCELRLCCCCCR